MTSEPFRLHIALFPSIAAIVAADGGKMLVTRIRATYSKSLSQDKQTPKGTIVKYIVNRFDKFAQADWKVEQTGKAISLKDILNEIKMNGVPDMIIEQITFVIPWNEYSTYTMKNENIMKSWNFTPYTFRRGIWKRLKALENFPAKKLYEKYRNLKEMLTEDLDDTTRKRWRDTILLNEPHPELNNAEIRSMWTGKKFSLILKEARGNFELMDIGEWRA